MSTDCPEPRERRTPSGTMRYTLLRHDETHGGQAYEDVEYDVDVDLDAETAVVRTATGYADALPTFTDLPFAGLVLRLTAPEMFTVWDAAAREDMWEQDRAHDAAREDR